MTVTGVELDRRIDAFEAAWADGPPDLAAFLPPAGDSQFVFVLAELVRVDMEFRRAHGEGTGLERYRSAFPTLFSDRAVIRELAFEEYRLRADAGEHTHPREYAARYGIDTSGWPAPAPESLAPTQVQREGLPKARAHADGLPLFPLPGETVEGYSIVSELGRGSFGRVYLAEEVGLAGRRVALKLSTRFGVAESETLARLQHTHIVPVYSTHRAGPFQLVVMPFLGTATLADLLADLKNRKTLPSSGRDIAGTVSGRRSDTVPAADPTAPPATRPADPELPLRALARFSYPDAVLWIAARLAEALAHAHARGILHRDVKPANVLLTDDGAPMLLDFNLASDGTADHPRIGGTLAYMAPEQLRAMRGADVQLDGRADVYALGIVLFELLTGRHPFPAPPEVLSDPTAFPTRPDVPPRLRDRNPAVSASAEAIVRRCLEFAPERRYASARELAEDLDRQLADQPLKHTGEPSIRERAGKWARRHPRLSSIYAVAAVALVIVGLLAGSVLARLARTEHLEATIAWATLRGEHEPLRARVLTQDLPVGLYAEAADRAATALTPYSALDDPEWANGRMIRRLPESDRAAARRDVALTLTYLADALAWQAARASDSARRAELLERAQQANDRAGAVSDPAVRTRVRLQRAALLRATGRPTEEPIDAAPTSDPETRAWAALSAGRYREVVEVLTPFTREPARAFTLWQALGDAHLHLGEVEDAVRCLDVAAALAPDEPAVSFLRGLALLEAGRHKPALAAFERVLERLPNDPETLLNRAVCHVELRDHTGAIADLDRLERSGAALPRLYFVRERARLIGGDAAAAARDRETGIGKEPTDAVGWVTRGRARLRQTPVDTKGALADFERAVAIDPNLRVGWENLAELLSERLNRPDEAVRALDRALAIAPAHLSNRAGRAVLHARAGRREAARTDAEVCLANRDTDALILYQIACVYLLTADGRADQDRGIALLRTCLRKDATWAKLMPSDPDLKSVHGAPEFRALIDAATVLTR